MLVHVVIGNGDMGIGPISTTSSFFSLENSCVVAVLVYDWENESFQYRSTKNLV